jgi:hypothetical protein
MNTTFLAWLAVAAVVGGALLLFLGMPAGEQPELAVVEAVPVESVAQVTDYWEPAAARVSVPTAIPAVSQAAVVRGQAIQPCASCGMAQPVLAPALVQHTQVQPCGVCGSRQVAVVRETSVCGTCGSVSRVSSPIQHGVGSQCSVCSAAATRSAVPVYMQYPQQAASCQQRPAAACGGMPCSSLSATCMASCGNTCPLDKPGINRNMELCVEECTFVQLHTTMSHPVCSDVRFEWTTSKGSFLEVNVPDPIYYVPTTHFADGEDVWVVVKITDSSGAQYTDQLKLHVTNQR